MIPLRFYGQGLGFDAYYHKGYIINKHGCSFFYEIEKNVLKAPLLVEFDSSVNVDKMDSLTTYYDPRGFTEQALIRISGKKSDKNKFECNDLSYEKIVVGEITSAHYTLSDFVSITGHIKEEIEEYFEEEGFYSKGLEHSAFTVLKDGSLQESKGWVFFDKNVADIDSIREITQHKSPEMKRGVYMKVRGKKKYGSCYGYGHFGGSSYELYVSEILAIDTLRTRFDFINNKLKTDGYYTTQHDTLNAPRLLKEGKEYLFKARSGKHDIVLMAKRINKAQITYTLTYYKKKLQIKKIKGLLCTDLFRNKMQYLESGGELTYVYESHDDKYRYGQSLITFFIYDIQNNVKFTIQDNYSNIVEDGYIEMTEIIGEK